MNRIAIAVCCCLMLCACTDWPLLYTYQAVENMSWDRIDTMRFEIERLESGSYDVSMGVRFSEEMPYEDLWLVLEHRIDSTTALALPKPLIIRRDTVHLVLANESGDWIVPGLTLHTKEKKVFSFEIPESRASFLIYHIMERQEIPGICEVGIKVK